MGDAIYDDDEPGLLSRDYDIACRATAIFRKPAMELSMKSGRELVIRPVNLDDSGPFEFIIPGHGSNYLKLDSARLYGKCRILQGDGDIIDSAGHHIGIVNTFPTSWIADLDIEVKGASMPEVSNKMFNYKAYLESILSYGGDAASSHMHGGLFVMDTPNHYDSTVPAQNTGFQARSVAILNSRPFDFMVPLRGDFLQMDRLLPPRVDLKVSLKKAPDAFSIMTNHPDGRYKIVFDVLELYVQLVEVHEKTMAMHGIKWIKEDAIFPINRCVMKKFTVTQQQISHYVPNVFGSMLPVCIVVGQVASTAQAGTYNLNPFNFRHFNLNKIHLTVNGDNVPSKPYTPDFANGLWMREFGDLFHNLGMLNVNTGNSVASQAFPAGCTLFAFDLTPDKCNGGHTHFPGSGNIELHVGYSQALAQSVELIVYAIFAHEVTIDQDRTAHCGPPK
jgi:hypothetical protein